MITHYIIVLVTTSGISEAQRISRSLLESKQAACVNVIPNVSSSFWWNNKIDSAEETLLVIKTTSVLLDGLIKSVKQLHSYEVPEIIALPVCGGNSEYLKWINSTLSQ